jgi:predicted small lipoprotein YifL
MAVVVLKMSNAKRLLQVSLLASVLLLAACGQKGPLYLEGDKETITNSADTAAPETRP